MSNSVKKKVYITLSIFFGILLASLVHALIELAYLQWAENTGTVVAWTKYFGVGSCALHPVVQYGIFVIGIAFGYFFGRVGWHIVYVEKRVARWKKKHS